MLCWLFGLFILAIYIATLGLIETLPRVTRLRVCTPAGFDRRRPTLAPDRQISLPADTAATFCACVRGRVGTLEIDTMQSEALKTNAALRGERCSFAWREQLRSGARLTQSTAQQQQQHHTHTQ